MLFSDFQTYLELLGVLSGISITIMTFVKTKIIPIFSNKESADMVDYTPNWANKDSNLYPVIMLWINIAVSFGLAFGSMLIVSGLSIVYISIVGACMVLATIGGYELVVNHLRAILNKKIL